MNSSLAIKIDIKPNGNEIHLSGAINEDSDFTALENLTPGLLIFNFESVTIINSCGIREWIKLLTKLKAHQIRYINCPQIIIEQMNLVHGFLDKNTEIESFYAPYFCDSCDKEVKMKLHTSKVTQGHAPKINCPTCQNELEFDALEKQYFQFMTLK